MDKSILIVHQDPEMILAIRDIIDNVSRGKGCEFVVRHAKTQMAAADLARTKTFDLVIVGLEIALDDTPQQPAGEHSKGGQDLIRTLRQIKDDMAAILITGHLDDDIYDFTEEEDVSLAREGKHFTELLIDKIEKSLLASGTGKTRHIVELEITLNRDGLCLYQIQREGLAMTKPRLLDVSPELLNDLVEKSRDVHVLDNDKKTWKRDLREIGESLLEELFSKKTNNNAAFLREFSMLEGAVHGLENIRIRFVVEETLHPIALEALKEKEQQKFWMLTTPIYRRLERPIESIGLDPKGLFQDEETRTRPINILIINANVPEDVYLVDEERKLDLKIKHLKNLEQEVKSLDELFRNLKDKRGRIGNIRILEEATIPAGTTFAEEIEQTLKSGNWHIVHYGGHTHFNSTDKVGYVFLPSKVFKKVEPIKIETFALWLRDCARFVFLSSCTSAEQAFMFRLASQGVSAIMGFLWSVEDQMARDFAESFYTYLFSGEEQSLEYAYWRAKVDMYDRHEDNPIWATPVLVTEVGIQEPRYAGVIPSIKEQYVAQ